jgi:LacI family transcriptional regulator
VTIKDIASASGFSVATVSYVLNGKYEEVSDETVKKVMKKAREMNYSRNQVAKSLVTKKSDTLAILVPDVSNMFYATIIKAASKSASKKGYSILLCDTDNDATEELQQLRLLDNRMIDGILLASRNSQNLLNQYENSRKLPIVILDEETTTKENKIFTVTSDNELAAYKMTKHLLSLGHRTFFCLTGVAGSTNSDRRESGVKKALSEYGIVLNEDRFVRANYKMNNAFEIIKRQDKTDYTALICFNDMMAYGAIKALVEKGLEVPADVSVVGFDTNTSRQLVSDISKFELTSINQNEELIGNVSTELLINAIQGKIAKKKLHLLPADWFLGSSTAAVNKD